MNKILNLNFWESWFEKLSLFIRKQKLKLYKGKKIKEDKTKHHRMYFAKFKIHVDDKHNPQVSDVEYEMVIPGQAIYFAKKNVEEAVKRKIYIEISEIDEMTDEEFESFEKSKEEQINL